jgi:SAM-dependent methyltransferase
MACTGAGKRLTSAPRDGMMMSVRMASATASMPAAIEQALALFEPEDRPANARLKDGYLDLLGEEDPLGPRFAQRSSLSRLAPFVYIRLAHPLAMRAAAGLKAPGVREEQRLALAMLDLSSGDRVLDLACGPGHFTRRFADATGDGLVVGLDASSPMLAAAARRTKSANVAYIRGDACALPFRASSYNAVCCFGALHLFEPPMQALDEIVRVLAPGGRVAFLTTCEDNPSASSDGSEVRRFGGMLMFARDELTGALGDRGLVDVEQRVIRAVQLVSARKPTA